MRYVATAVLSLACGSFAVAQVSAPGTAPTSGVQQPSGSAGSTPGASSGSTTPGASSGSTPGASSPGASSGSTPGASGSTPGASTPGATRPGASSGSTPGAASGSTPGASGSTPGASTPGSTRPGAATPSNGARTPDATTTPGSTVPSTDRAPGAERSGAGRGDMASNQNNQLHSLVVHCLTLKNQCEVETAKLATSKAQHEQVKEFAQTMQKEHQQAITDLAALKSSSSAGAGSPAGASPSAGTSSAGTDTSAAGGRPQGQGVVAKLTQLEDAQAQIVLQMTKEELSSKSGHEFDMAYIGLQVVKHQLMLAELKALQQVKVGSPELQSFVSKAQEMTQHHLDQAKQIKESLKQNTQAGR